MSLAEPRIAVGLTLQADDDWLDALGPVLLEDCDLYGVEPETIWRRDPVGQLAPARFHRLFQALPAQTGRPVVGLGRGLSLGSTGRHDGDRRADWLGRIAADHQAFSFRWYAALLATTHPAGEDAGTPLPVPLTPHALPLARRILDELRAVVPRVAVGNALTHVVLGDWRDEASLLRELAAHEDTWLVIDLFAVLAMAQGMDRSIYAWLDALDPARVLALRVSGGRDAPAAWTGGAVRHVGTPRGPAPEEVWYLLDELGARCPHLDAVLIDRHPGTVRPGDDARVRADLDRARALAARWR